MKPASITLRPLYEGVFFIKLQSLQIFLFSFWNLSNIKMHNYNIIEITDTGSNF